MSRRSRPKEALLRPSCRQTHRDVQSGWRLRGKTRRGESASERAVRCSAGKTNMSYTEDEQAGGGGNGRRAGERGRLRRRAAWSPERWWCEVALVHKRAVAAVVNIVGSSRAPKCRLAGGRRIRGSAVVASAAGAGQMPSGGHLGVERAPVWGGVKADCISLSHTTSIYICAIPT